MSDEADTGNGKRTHSHDLSPPPGRFEIDGELVAAVDGVAVCRSERLVMGIARKLDIGSQHTREVQDRSRAKTEEAIAIELPNFDQIEHRSQFPSGDFLRLRRNGAGCEHSCQ